MSKIRFSNYEIDKLSNNKYVLKVSDKAITYTNELRYILLLNTVKERLQELFLRKLDLMLMLSEYDV